MKRESRIIPIVFVSVSDPIGSGFVASLARPNGNLMGLLLYEDGITSKWLVGTGPFLASNREQIVALAARDGVPAIYSLREFVSSVD
jgi:hypothetical protein